MCPCMNVCMFTCKYTCMHACIHVHMCVCMGSCMYMYVCMYLYIACINVSSHFELCTFLTPDLKFAQDLTLKILPAVKPLGLMCLIQMNGALCSKNVII